MIIAYHLVLTILICIFCFQFYGWNVIFILLGGVLVDIDHYLLYILKYRTINIKKAYQRFKGNIKRSKREEPTAFELLFHSIEFFVLMIILSFFSQIFFLIFIGLFFHLLTDGVIKKWITQIIKKKRIMDYSIIGWFKYRKL